MRFWDALIEKSKAVLQGGIRSPEDVATRAAVEAYAEKLPATAKKAVIEIFGQVEKAVSARRLEHTYWWVDLRTRFNEPATEAVMEIPAVKDYLDRHGIEVETWRTTLKIKASPTPAEGTYGAELQARYDAYEAHKAAEKSLGDEIRNGM